MARGSGAAWKGVVAASRCGGSTRARGTPKGGWAGAHFEYLLTDTSLTFCRAFFVVFVVRPPQYRGFTASESAEA